MRHFKSSLAVFTVVAFFIATPEAATLKAEMFYSIDQSQGGSADRLVAIESTTGSANVIGFVGDQLGRVDLAMLDGHLFALDTVLGTKADLVELSTTTGGIISRVQLTANAGDPGNAEGLTEVDGQLVVSYRGPNQGGAFSNLIGDLALDGTITTPRDPAEDDIDSLATSSTGKLYGLDGSTDGVHSDIITIGHPDPTVQLVGRYSTIGLNAIAFDSSGRFFGIDSGFSNGTKGVREFDPINGDQIGFVAYDSQFELYGLAPIPEPATLTFLALGSLTVLRRRRKQ